ncbi:hypothetical protein BCY91_15090 [Pelobium manganitolerans]|uniref:SIMPL domain-containing protein n=1 Tax=Pelobium manganitolerans TaxID=1842495 RepID=A0A419S9K0_9SPHI|nr:SIMPL domain-containing protein [Pelobium manganitolerans]RKD18659.1 hypothetical protein BCY91_15090 [Pelobium manganitolerans]
MKKFLLIAIIAFASTSLFAQNADLRKKIEVSGSAEQEVTPDEIYIGISLKEYMKDNKNKVGIDELEAQLQKAVTKAGIAQEDFMINNINAYNNYWDKKKDPAFLASKQYSIKVKDLNKFNALIAALDPKGIAYSNIERYAYSKEDELKKELKIKALRQAKEKATYLVEAIGEKLWGVIEISESDNSSFPQPIYRTAMLKTQSFESADAASPIDFKTIKISVNIRAVFEIK